MASDSIHAIWVDPLAFESLENGPPYMPEPQRARTVMASGDVLVKFLPEFEGLPMAELGVLVGVLRAASIVHQSHHWQTSGGNFYGDHLLFDRLYNESLGAIDSVAERAVGSGDSDLVCPKSQAAIVNELVGMWCGSSESGPDDMVSVGLVVEGCVLDCIKAAKARLSAQDQLSEGTDNLLQGVADKHEEFVYLLQQRGIRMASYDYRMAAEGKPKSEKSRQGKANKALDTLCKKYYKSLPLDEIKKILKENEFNEDAVDGIYTGREGKSHEQVGPKSWLTMTWHKMEESGNWEVVAYIS